MRVWLAQALVSVTGIFVCIVFGGTRRWGPVSTLNSEGLFSMKTNFTLEIAHINDHHSHLDPELVETFVGDVRTRFSLGSLPALARLFNSLPSSVLKIHAGDAITGTLFYTLFRGRVDAELMKQICFDVFVLGNHEFDDGDGSLKVFLDDLKRAPCNTSVLSANLRPKIGTPLARSTQKDVVRPWSSKTINGVRIAIIGITVRNKTMLSSRPLPTTMFLDEFSSAQATIDEVANLGFKHIVLVTHQGYQMDVSMASRLRGVDVIIGGDSHSLLGSFKGSKLTTEGPYPTTLTNADGHVVCVGQAWEFSKAFGHMQVTFSADGDVLECSGKLVLPVGHSNNPEGLIGAHKGVKRYSLEYRQDAFVQYEGSNTESRKDFAAGFPPNFGSGMHYKGLVSGAHQFYVITDRGPTGDAPSEASAENLGVFGSRGSTLKSISRTFPAPNFVPSIGLISINASTAVHISTIPVRRSPSGQNVSGLPLPPGIEETDVLERSFRYGHGGAVGELPLTDLYSFSHFDDLGVDPEGVAFDDQRGVFWLSEEYGPSLLQVQSVTGEIVQRYFPGEGRKDLPKIFSERGPNRGFVGLCMDKDSGHLHTLLQSPIDPRDNQGQSRSEGGRLVKNHAKFVRWLEFDPVSEESKVYALPIDASVLHRNEPGEVMFGDIACLGNGKFVALVAGDSSNSSQVLANQLHLVQIPTGVTDISRVNECLEISSIQANVPCEMDYAEVVSLQMTKFFDLTHAGWTSDSAQGLALVDESTLAVINDNSFGSQTRMMHLEGVLVPSRSLVRDCAVLANSGQFTKCTQLEGFSVPPARIVRKTSSTTIIWIITFALPLHTVFPRLPHIQHFSQSSKKWVDVNRSTAAEIERILNQDTDSSLSMKVVEVDVISDRITKSYSAPMAELRKEVIGKAKQILCQGRIPGKSSSNPNTPECQASTAERGSTMTQIAADAMLNSSRQAAIAIQNAGGVRQGVLTGDITYDTAYLLMPFSNSLFQLEMTGQEILDTLEEAAHYSLTISSGSFPYAAGLRWCFNLGAAKGSRFSRVQVRNKFGADDTSERRWQNLSGSETYVVMANDFIAGGGDGYATLRNVTLSGRGMNTYLYDTQVLINYFRTLGVISPPSRSDYSLRTEAQCSTNTSESTIDPSNLSGHGESSDRLVGSTLVACWLLAGAAFAWHRRRSAEAAHQAFHTLEEVEARPAVIPPA